MPGKILLQTRRADVEKDISVRYNFDVAFKRTTIFLRPSVIDRLRAVSRRTGAPVAESIRRGIEMFLSAEEPKKKLKKGSRRR
jgi:predicted DNA-binding protein